MLAADVTRNIEITAAAAATASLTDVDHDAAHRLFDAVGEAARQFEALDRRIARECFGNPDRLGVCGTCGKVVPPADGHDPGGCMHAIALGVVAIARLPRRLRLRARYLLRRRGSAR